MKGWEGMYDTPRCCMILSIILVAVRSLGPQLALQGQSTIVNFYNAGSTHKESNLEAVTHIQPCVSGSRYDQRR